MYDNAPKGQTRSRPIMSIHSEWIDTSLMMRLVELESNLRHNFYINAELFQDQKSIPRIVLDEFSYIDISPLNYNYRFNHYHRIIGYYIGLETRTFKVISDYTIQHVERMTQMALGDKMPAAAPCEDSLDSSHPRRLIDWLTPFLWFALILLTSFLFLIGIPR